MLSKSQIRNFKMVCADWLENYLRKNNECSIKGAYIAGSKKGFSKLEIKAARAWLGKQIVTSGKLWRWDL